MKVVFQERKDEYSGAGLQRNEETKLRHVGDVLIEADDHSICLSVCLWLDDSYNLIVTGEGAQLLEDGRFSCHGEHQAVFFSWDEAKRRLKEALG